MAVKVGMKNNAGDVKSVKVGWSWTCFFFGWFFGIPWFMRKLPIYGMIGVVISLSSIWGFMRPGADVSMASGNALWSLVFAIVGGIMANKLTIKNLYKKGYKFTNPESPEVVLMNSKYHVF